MKCHKCNQPMFIRVGKYFFEGDNDPNVTTKVYQEVFNKCVNPICTEIDKEVITKRLIAENT